jgi:hypothetical protein
MSQQVAEQLVYKLVQSFTLPTKLDTCVRIATCPHEVGDLTGEFLAIRWQLDGQRLQIGGEFKVSGTLILPGGQLQLFTKTNSFGLKLLLPEKVLAGHVTIVPEVEGLTYTIDQIRRKQVDIKIVIPCSFTLKVMAAGPSKEAELLAQGCFRSAFVPVVLLSQEESFRRELLLPLDPPGRKIVRADINEQNVRAHLALPSVVSGIANEDILYLGIDGCLHELNHTTDWSHLWPTEIKLQTGQPQVTVRGEIIRAELMAQGHTLSLSIKETINLKVCQERPTKVLLANDNAPSNQSLLARIPFVVAEQSESELVPVSLTLNEEPTVPGQPQVKIINLGGRAHQGQVVLSGLLEIAFPYVDHMGRERFWHSTMPLTRVIAIKASSPGQQVHATAAVESVQFTVPGDRQLELQALCVFQVYLLEPKLVAVMMASALPEMRAQQAQALIEQLVGEQSRDMLLEETMMFSDNKFSVVDHSVSSEVSEVHVGYGSLSCRGEVLVGLYYLSESREECYQELRLPWQITLDIAAAKPQWLCDVTAEANLLPLELASDNGGTVIRVACTVVGRAYCPSVVSVITGLYSHDPATSEWPIKATLRQEAELGVMISPRRWRPSYGGRVAVEVKQVSFKAGQGEVTALGELALAVDYTLPLGTVQRWQEERPFELVFACPKAKPGLEVRGELKVTEVLHQKSSKKDAQRPRAGGQSMQVAVVFMADLVLL